MAHKYANADPYLCASPVWCPPCVTPARATVQDLCVTHPEHKRKIAAQTIDVIKSIRDDLVTRGGCNGGRRDLDNGR